MSRRINSRNAAGGSNSGLHRCDAPQVGDLCVQDLDVSEGLSLTLLLGREAEVGLTWVPRAEAAQLSLQLSPGLVTALKEGLKIR